MRRVWPTAVTLLNLWLITSMSGRQGVGNTPHPHPTPAPWFVNCPAFTLDNHKNGRGVCSPGFGTIIACPFFQGSSGADAHIHHRHHAPASRPFRLT